MMLEARGIPTVVVGLIRLHMEKVKVPRGLWVPFELGRPLGEPEDAAFQTRVLRAALGLFEAAAAPSTIVDFPEEAPGRLPLPGWRPAVTLAQGLDLAAEIRALAPAQAAHAARRGRSTVGLTGLAPAEWAGLLTACLTGTPAASPRPGLSPAQLLKFCADDLKAYYSEAAQSDGARPSSGQVDDWFWRETAAGRALQAIRKIALASDQAGLKAVGGNLIVPGARVVPG